VSRRKEQEAEKERNKRRVSGEEQQVSTVEWRYRRPVEWLAEPSGKDH
jgi:hypothetical protein